MKEQIAVVQALRPDVSQQLERLEIDNIDMWSMVMDAMKESVPEKGTFFVEVGGKNQPVRFSGRKLVELDTRALILTESVKDNEGEDVYIAITREGVKAMKDPFINSGATTNWLTRENMRVRDAYNNQRHIFSLSSIVNRLKKGDIVFYQGSSRTGLQGTDKDSLFEDEVKEINFGSIHDSLRSAFPYLKFESISYPVEDVVDVELIQKAFGASYASAKRSKKSPARVMY